MGLCWLAAPLPRLSRSPSHLSTPCMCESTSTPQRRRKRKSNAPTKRSPGVLLQVLDNLTDKQYGRGQIYYGPRSTEVQTEEEEEEVWEELKPDAILVVGGTGRTGQWVTLGLLNQGFNVRVLTREFGRAEKLFGTTGANVDVFEGDLNDEETLKEAVKGARAVVCVAGGGPSFFGRRKPPSASKLVQVAANIGVTRFVLVEETESEAVGMLRESSLPYVVVSADKLLDEEGGLREVLFTPVLGKVGDDDGGRGIARLDLAQVVCQALVYDRFIETMASTDEEDGAFEFPNVVLHVRNGDEEFQPDNRFWRDRFATLSDAFVENVEDVNVDV